MWLATASPGRSGNRLIGLGGGCGVVGDRFAVERFIGMVDSGEGTAVEETVAGRGGRSKIAAGGRRKMNP